MSNIASGLAVFVVASFAACGGSDSGDTSSSEVLDDYVVESRSFADVMCSCSLEPDLCQSSFEFPSARVACIENLIAAEAAAYEPYLQCMAGVLSESAQCLGALECSDEEGMVACSEVSSAAEDACPSLSETASAMLEACRGA